MGFLFEFKSCCVFCVLLFVLDLFGILLRFFIGLWSVFMVYVEFGPFGLGAIWLTLLGVDLVLRLCFAVCGCDVCLVVVTWVVILIFVVAVLCVDLFFWAHMLRGFVCLLFCCLWLYVRYLDLV